MPEYNILFNGDSDDLRLVTKSLPDNIDYTVFETRQHQIKAKVVHAIGSLEEEFDIIERDTDNQQMRMRKAIELHTKLDRVAAELQEDPNATDDDKARVGALIDRLLTDIFRIDPK